MWDKTLGLQIDEIGKFLPELKNSTHKWKRALYAELEPYMRKKLGCSGVCPRFMVSCFIAPYTKSVIHRNDPNHWNSQVMVGLYNIPSYGAIGKLNTTITGNPAKPNVTEGYCSLCTYVTGNMEA